MFFFLIFVSGVVLFQFFPFFPISSVSSLAFGSLLLARSGKYLLIFALVLGFSFALFRYSPPDDQPSLSKKRLDIDCVVSGLERGTDSGSRINRVRVESSVDALTGEHLAAIEGKEMDIVSAEGLRNGWRYNLIVRSFAGEKRLNPGMTGAGVSFATLEEIKKAEPGGGNPFVIWLRAGREGLHHHLNTVFDRDTAALLSSVTIGETSGMSRELRTAFSRTGLSHLLSISGTHFGLFSMFVFGIFRLLVRSMPYRFLQRVTIFVTPSQAAAIISLPFILVYLLISGMSIPALRSFMMINVFLLGILIGRKGMWLNSLLLAAFLLCLWDPSSVAGLPFQLSFLAVLFIGFFAIERGKKDEGIDISVRRGRLREAVGTSVLLSLAATLGTAPLVAYYFHYFSVISPLTNLIVTPLVGFVLVPLSLVAAFTFIFTGHYPFPALIGHVSDAAVRVVRFFAAMPFADVKIPAFPVIVLLVFYGGLLVYILSGRKRYMLLITLMALIVCVLPHMTRGRDMSVTYLDVGHGDSAVVQTSGGRIIVIDTGRTGKELEGYLRYLGKEEIHALAVTHADDDHAGGLPYIAKNFSVREIWDSGLIEYREGLLKNTDHRLLERGDVATGEGFSVYVLHPYKGFYTLDGGRTTEDNNNSLVLKVAGRKKTFLFAGDAAGEAEEDMVHLGKWLRSDVLKIGHHGSRMSTTEDFMNEVSPDMGIISVGRDNLYGHPHEETLRRLQGMRLCRTDRDGAIKVSEGLSGLDVKTYSEYRFERTRSVDGEWRNINRLFAVW